MPTKISVDKTRVGSDSGSPPLDRESGDELLRRIMAVLRKIFAVIVWLYRGVLSFFKQTTTPLWMTLLLTLGGTYLLVPWINDNVQRENLRREFLVTSLSALSSDTIELITQTNAFIREGYKVEGQSLITERIVQLQYRIVQLNLALPSKAKAGNEIQTLLNGLLSSVGSTDPEVRALIPNSLSEFSRASFMLYREVISDAGLV